ncbi:MAG TPA: futalosine hydrolase [Drouetiella sp.]
MHNSFSDFFSRDKRLLLAVASGGEYGAVLKALNASDIETSRDWCAIHFDTFSVLQTGVGKANAAGAVTHEFMDGKSNDRNYSAVLSFGIAGSLAPQVEIGSTIFGSSAVFADEGTPCIGGQDWTSLEQSGWARTAFVQEEQPWTTHLSSTADHIGVIATISTISGTDEIASQYAKRTGALAESMEGAAIAQVCLQLELPFAELRVISNRCGDRNVNKLDIPTSFKRLIKVVQDWNFTACQD